MSDLHFLFLQGLPSPFFSRVAHQLSTLGAKTTGINLCVGDTLFWRGSNTANYRGRLSDWPSYIANFLDENSITDIILLGEQRSYHKYAIEAAKARGIRVTVTDFGYLRPDWITLEADGMGGLSKFPKDSLTILKLAAQSSKLDSVRRYSDNFSTMAKGDMLYHFGNFFFWWLFPYYQRPYKRNHPILHYPAIGRRLLFAKRGHRHAERRLSELRGDHVRYFVFPLQLENDFQIVAYSPFSSLEEAIQLVVQSFAEHADADMRLLVKVHPLDPGLKNWRKLIYRLANELGIASRIDYFDGGNLDDIIIGAEGMITINSTAAIRALQLGSPVMTLGDAIYDVAGLTYQGHIDQYWKNAEQPVAALVDAFINAIANTIQIRGVFYSEPGLTAAVTEAVDRLYQGKVGASFAEVNSQHL
jgi:capsular polysaccharide export protein